MLPTPRHYQHEDDLTRMLALLQAGRAARNGSYYIHTGDLKWWLYYPALGTSWWEHIYLWEDTGDGHLLGWALLDPSGETWDVYPQPELLGTPLAAEMYSWAERMLNLMVRALGLRQVSVYWVTPGDSFRCNWLEANGYLVTSESPELVRPLSGDIPVASLPQGFQVRACRGLDEVESRARAQYAAFGSSANFELYLQRFRHFMQSCAYQPAADMVVVAPDGRIAAFCITWIDEHNNVGLFEPVGTHPDFQRKGLGKAVMLAALRRLQTLGMQQAIVTTGQSNHPALQLYRSIGFEQYAVFRYYTKDLSEKD